MRQVLIDAAITLAYSLPMSLHLTPELERRLEQLAAQTGRTPEDLTVEALDLFVTEQEESIAAIREGDDDIARGNVLSHEEVVARFERRFSKA
jgi:predicted transcriptional regulator